MLKKSASGVLASLRGSTYRSVRLASSTAAALLDSLFEHPEVIPAITPYGPFPTILLLATTEFFSNLLDRSVEREAAYLRMLQPSVSLQMLPVNRDVLVAAARLRADTSIKLPDAIHAATAQIAGCSYFLTNDSHVKIIPGLTILSLTRL